MSSLQVTPGYYRHFKGGIYHVKAIATHTETGEELVVYFSLDIPQKVWVRPSSMWYEVVPDPDTGQLVPRFQKVPGWLTIAQIADDDTSH
jgi:hypothetical protein